MTGVMRHSCKIIQDSAREMGIWSETALWTLPRLFGLEVVRIRIVLVAMGKNSFTVLFKGIWKEFDK